jgi:hypothetical protein
VALVPQTFAVACIAIGDHNAAAEQTQGPRLTAGSTRGAGAAETRDPETNGPSAPRPPPLAIPSGQQRVAAAPKRGHTREGVQLQPPAHPLPLSRTGNAKRKSFISRPPRAALI